MPKFISFKKNLLNILFWSIIAAAFIGPGTVTTASKAGASFGLSLLWALVFSTIATVVLQEAAARITIASGKSLGEIIALKYQRNSNQKIKVIIFLAVAFGCAAYQAGNMLGAISGIDLVSDFNIKILTLILGFVCAILLWIGNLKIIAHALGLIVAVMGSAFIYVAFQADLSFGNVMKNAIIPSFPDGSSLLIIGLIGTTIVPYNLFLASGISKGQNIRDMRVGITVAVIIGGLISMCIMIAGTQVSGEFSFKALSDTLASNIGNWAAVFFGCGLFAAGFSSSITSPLAAAVTARSLFGQKDEKWLPKSRNFRLVWGLILLIGLGFGVSDVKPIPAIILAQAINGALLPIIAIFLMLAVNDKKLLSEKYVNSRLTNVMMLLIVGVTSFLGVNNFMKAIFSTFSVTNPNLGGQIAVSITSILMIWLGLRVFRK